MTSEMIAVPARRTGRMLVAIVALAVSARLVHAQTPNRCATVQPDDSAGMVAVRRFVAAGGHVPVVDSMRRSLGVDTVDTADVLRIRSDKLCRLALAARLAYLGMAADDGLPVRVYGVGDRYFVEEIGSREWRVVWVFGREWNHLGNIGL